MQTTLKCNACGNTEDFFTVETQYQTVHPAIYLDSENNPTVDITAGDFMGHDGITCGKCDSKDIETPDDLQENYS